MASTNFGFVVVLSGHREVLRVQGEPPRDSVPNPEGDAPPKSDLPETEFAVYPLRNTEAQTQLFFPNSIKLPTAPRLWIEKHLADRHLADTQEDLPTLVD